jgi:ABC-type multidrug transport system fused ATPase/permease subunit
LVLCWYNIGISGLFPFAFVTILVLPLQFYLARWTSAVSGPVTDLITKRVHLMSEILTAIKLIKFYAWESFYRQKVTKMRKIELKGLRKELGLKIAGFTIVFTAPVVTTLLSLSMYCYFGNDLTPSVVFTLLWLFNTLRHPLLLLPIAERSVDGASNAVTKLEAFLLFPEVDVSPEPCIDLDPLICTKFENACFEWDGVGDYSHPHLYDLNLTLNRGELIAVVGDIGSCKSLLAAIGGQINLKDGKISTNGAVCGFIPQEPWLIHASLRDNILFGINESDEDLSTINAAYTEAIRISGLTRDFLLLSNGDDAYVNELNLSHSQKQRISLARCIIHNPDIVLMEDCLRYLIVLIIK